MPAPTQRRVLTISPMPPEKSAYALARYSRSPDSISQSIDWVRTHDSHKFLDSFYFQYGHASIADLAFTRVVGGNLVKVLAWYDNEMGYTHTLVEHVIKAGRLI